MKLLLLLLTLSTLAAGGQPQGGTAADFKARYERQVKAVGPAGLGVESILDRWEAAFPKDPEMLDARFLWAYNKSQKTEVTVKNQERFMGGKPLLSLPDSLAPGGKRNYFEEIIFDPELYASACLYIDRAIREQPHELKYRFDKISALISYEKESPDMTTDEIRTLLDYNASASPQWTFRGKKAGTDVFKAAIQEYLFTFFRIGSPECFESFKNLSEKALGYWPKDPVFLDNIGSWYLVAKKNHPAALKCYKKVLKIAPDDYTAIKNILIIARSDKDVKLEKKYLQKLIKVAETDAEKSSAQARLDYLNGKKK